MKKMTGNETAKKIKACIEKSIVGCETSSDLLLIALLSKGHVLIEDVPGTGKTMLVKALSSSVDCAFSRIQFTPDLLPSDITGINFFNMKSSEFEFMPGPVFTNILLADEINRATPKTQSGLLECMEEKQATIDGKTYLLPDPFMVVATQNPVENMGTFPLPEAQLDRFMFKISLGYPSHEESKRIISMYEKDGSVKNTSPAVSKKELEECSSALASVYTDEDIFGYIVSVCEATRHAPGVVLGVSTRGAIALCKAAKGYAFLDGRTSVIPDDVKKAAVPTLSHRLILTSSEKLKKNAAAQIIEGIISETPVPTERVFDGGATRLK